MRQSCFKTVVCLLATCLLVACADKRYDLSNGINVDLTLFGDEISVPIGSIGPISPLPLLFESQIGTMVSEIMKVDEEGYVVSEFTGDLYASNIYEMANEVGDVSKAFTYKAGSPSGYVYGASGMLSLLKIYSREQTVEIFARNPLRTDIPVRGSLDLNCSDSYQASYPLKDALKTRSADPYSYLKANLPDNVTAIPRITLTNLELDMPADPVGKISDSQLCDVLSLTYRHRAKLAIGQDFLFNYTYRVEDAKLEIGKYNLSQCNLSLEVVNSLPLSVRVVNVSVLKPAGESDAAEEVDDNISISSDILIAGGSPSHPGETLVQLHIAAREGTIPDIHGLKIALELEGAQGCEDVALSTSQQIYVKSSSAKLSGGITLPLSNQ